MSNKVKNIFEMDSEELQEYNESKLLEFKELFLTTDLEVDEIYNRIGVSKGGITYRYINGSRKAHGLSAKNRPVKDEQAPNERHNTSKNTKTKLTLDKTPEECYKEYKHLFLNTELSISEIYDKIGVPQNQNTHYVYIRRQADADGLDAYARRMNLKHGGRPKGSKNLKNLSDEEREKVLKYFEKRYQEFLEYYKDLDLSVGDILKKMGTHHKSNMYFYFRERMKEDGLDPTKRQGKVNSNKIKKTYNKRRKENEPIYEEAYHEYKKLFLETKLSMDEIWSELGVEPRSVCAHYIRDKAKKEGLNSHERRWNNFKEFQSGGEFEKAYDDYKKLFLDSDMNIMDIYKELGVGYETRKGHYIRERAKNEGLNTNERISRLMTKDHKSLEECEELFIEYKGLFNNSKLRIPEIYEKIGVKDGSYEFRYIRKRAREEGLDGKKRMYKLRRRKINDKKYADYPKGKKRYSKYSERTLKQVENSKDLLNRLFMERNVKEGTGKGYIATMHHWFTLFGDKYETLQDVIDKYVAEEDKRIPMRERTIKSDLLGFREYLINCKSMNSSKSIMSYYQKFTAFLRHFGLEVPALPKAKLEKGYVSNYNDLPTHEMIRTACEQSPDILKAVILFMSSSGSAKAETLSITVGMFLEGCKEYLKEMPNPVNMDQCIQELKDRHDIVPLIYLRRIKTDKWYYTCCSPEASYYIIEYLNANYDLGWDDQLFPYGSSLLLTRFQEINDRNNWGKVGQYRRFRGHVLRKFMASNIGLPRDQVDSFQGRSKDMIQEAYFKQDPRQLKQIYMNAMYRVMIYDNWGHDLNNEELDIEIPKGRCCCKGS